MSAPFPPPPWDALQRGDPGALPTVHDLPLAQSAAALAMLLDENKDEQILKEACLGLCQPFGDGIQNDRILAILEADVVPRLVALLKPNRSRNVPVSVQAAALQVIGNVACGDNRQTQVITDCEALPCLKALLSSADRGIRKEVCWISSNITESSHQVQAVLDAGILPPLLKLLESQDNACREDATWVLYNISSNHDMRQISYLAEQSGIRALCNLLSFSQGLDVLWKGCGTVAVVALKGLRNIIVAGQHDAANSPNGYNKMTALVAEASGVERMEALASHVSFDVRQSARSLLERFFGAEPAPSSADAATISDDHANAANAAAAAAASAAKASAVYPGTSPAHVSTSLFPDPDVAAAAVAGIADPVAFAAKLGKAVCLGHSHFVTILLPRMAWSQRVAATKAPALLHPGRGQPDSAVSSSLPAILLAAHLGKPEYLALLLRCCRPDLRAARGKKRLTPQSLAWPAHQGHYRCCELLLEHGASAGAKGGEYLTALNFFVSGGVQILYSRVIARI